MPFLLCSHIQRLHLLLFTLKLLVFVTSFGIWHLTVISGGFCKLKSFFHCLSFAAGFFPAWHSFLFDALLTKNKTTSNQQHLPLLLHSLYHWLRLYSYYYHYFIVYSKSLVSILLIAHRYLRYSIIRFWFLESFADMVCFSAFFGLAWNLSPFTHSHKYTRLQIFCYISIGIEFISSVF